MKALITHFSTEPGYIATYVDELLVFGRKITVAEVKRKLRGLFIITDLVVCH